MSHGHGVGDGWPLSAGRLVLVWLLLFVPEFCVPPFMLPWPKFDSPGASLSFSFLLSVSGSQVFSLVSMAVVGCSAGENTLKDFVFVPAARSLLVSGLCETDPKDMVSEVSGCARLILRIRCPRCLVVLDGARLILRKRCPRRLVILGVAKDLSRKVWCLSSGFPRPSVSVSWHRWWFLDFSGSGMVENGSLAAASCCSSLSS